jgi:hypothetical protein
MDRKFQMTNPQQTAIQNVKAKAQANQQGASTKISNILKKYKIDTDVATLIEKVRHTGVITINFHPDRLCSDGRSVAAALYEDGIFRTQFETGISNGGLNRIVGGQRDLWEEQLWGDVYLADGVSLSERPRYGGLNIMNYSDGASPRFGSCHFRLKSEVLSRSTFTFGDSNNTYKPDDIGVIDVFEPILAALFESIDKHGMALGRKDVGLVAYVNELLGMSNRPSIKDAKLGRALDDYIEAQIHSSIKLSDDVEAVVVDPSFRGTATGELLEAMAKQYDFEIDWHEGFKLEVDKVPSDFRGEEMPSLAKYVAEHVGTGQYIDAATIGQAAVSVVNDPEQWQEWGNVDEALQRIKYLWHILVIYG